ncbi:MAG: SDR family NAD(P)-dependent oxidoreductase [Anaerolineaceae bacterium]|nr:MAG: SDR family NAD(P)-dependent oxidoreductase [Anaerolineaceae bacterium]
MAYLVTGGAGFIGSRLARRLLDRGETVVILDNFNNYYDPALKRRNIAWLGRHPQLTMIEGDIRDRDTAETLFNQHEITHIAHMAAMPGVRASIKQAHLYWDVNLTGSTTLLEAAMRMADIQGIVLASTSSVYGETQNIPFVETDAADRPLAAYPASKRAMEMMGHTYFNLYKVPVTALRFFNIYGPMGRPDMMPLKLMEAAFSGKQIKLFNGGDIRRDWTYIDDAVDGVLAALDRPLGYAVINIGLGKPILLTDFVEIIEELTGREINKITVPTPLSDPPITYCDNTRAQQLLGFDPQVPLREGLQRTWEWFREDETGSRLIRTAPDA